MDAPDKGIESDSEKAPEGESDSDSESELLRDCQPIVFEDKNEEERIDHEPDTPTPSNTQEPEIVELESIPTLKQYVRAFSTHGVSLDSDENMFPQCVTDPDIDVVYFLMDSHYYL